MSQGTADGGQGWPIISGNAPSPSRIRKCAYVNTSSRGTYARMSEVERQRAADEFDMLIIGETPPAQFAEMKARARAHNPDQRIIRLLRWANLDSVEDHQWREPWDWSWHLGFYMSVVNERQNRGWLTDRRLGGQKVALIEDPEYVKTYLRSLDQFLRAGWKGADGLHLEWWFTKWDWVQGEVDWDAWARNAILFHWGLEQLSKKYNLAITAQAASRNFVQPDLLRTEWSGWKFEDPSAEIDQHLAGDNERWNSDYYGGMGWFRNLIAFDWTFMEIWFHTGEDAQARLEKLRRGIAATQELGAMICWYDRDDDQGGYHYPLPTLPPGF